MSSSKVFIGNLPFDLSETDIEEILNQYTKVHSIRLVKDSLTGESRGFGFAEVTDSENVIKKLDEKELQGHNLIIKYAFDRGNW